MLGLHVPVTFRSREEPRVGTSRHTLMRPTRALAVAVLTAVLTLSACSGAGDDDGGGGDTAGSRPAADQAEAPRRDGGGAMDSVDGVALYSGSGPDVSQPDATERSFSS